MATLEERVAALENDLAGLKVAISQVLAELVQEPQAKEIRFRTYGFYAEGYPFSIKAVAWIKKKMVETP